MSGFACMECGKRFRTIAAAERASSIGCPKCGGVDIDLAPTRILGVPVATPTETRMDDAAFARACAAEVVRLERAKGGAL